MRKTATIIALLTLSGCSTHTGQTGQMIVDSAKDGDVIGVGIMSVTVPFMLMMDVFTLGNTLDDDDVASLASAVEASADTYSASSAVASDETLVASNQSYTANGTQESAPIRSVQSAEPVHAGSQDELIASLKAHALPNCVVYRDSRFYNVCDFDIELSFCINNPAPFDKAPLTDAGAAYDCAKDQYGLWTIDAGNAMAGTFTGEWATFGACKRPYSPVKIKGIVGGVDHFACK